MNNNPAMLSAVGLICLYAACGALFFQHDRTLNELQRDFVLGRDGVRMLYVESDADISFEPWEPQEKNLTLLQMLGELCVRANKPVGCYREANVRYDIFRKEHWVEYGGKRYLLERNATPLAISDITPELISERMRLISAWAQKNQRADGALPYQYIPSADMIPDSNYAVRQLLSIQGLFAVARKENDQALRNTALKAERNLLARTYKSDPRGFSYIEDFDGQSSLGASALAILMIREEKHDAPITETEHQLAEFLLRMQRPDGSFQTLLGSATSTEGEQFYSGEALMALALLDTVSDDQRFSYAVEKGYEYYEKKLKVDFMPQYAPWHIQAYATAYRNTPQEKYAEYVYWLADGLIETMLNHDDRAREDEVGRFYNPEYPQWGPPHSASTSIYLEGLTYAYEIARDRGDLNRARGYKNAILLATRSLLLVQWTPETAYYLSSPDRAIGSFKVTITDNRGRIDQTGHTANALARLDTVLQD